MLPISERAHRRLSSVVASNTTATLTGIQGVTSLHSVIAFADNVSILISGVSSVAGLNTVTGLGGLTGVQGSITNQTGGAAVAGGYVGIYGSTPTTRLFELSVDGSGNFSKNNLTAGTYNLMYDPPSTFGVGTSEPTFRSVTVTTGQMVTQNFQAKSNIWYDGFSSYTSDAQLTSGNNNSAGQFFFGVTNGQISSVAGASSSFSSITRQNTGPSGEQVMRYLWKGVGSGGTVELSPRLNPPPTLNEISLRIYDRISVGFNNGDSLHSGSGREYKYILLKLGNSSNPQGTPPQIGVYMEQGSNGAQKKLTMDVTDRNSCNLNVTRTIASFNIPDDGAYHTTLIRGYNLCNGSTSTFEIWRDSVLMQTMSGVFLPGQASIGSGDIVVVEPGANINNGPDTSQSRDFREISLGVTRLSSRQGLAD